MTLEEYLLTVSDEQYIVLYKNECNWINLLQCGYKAYMINNYLDCEVLDVFMDEREELAIIIQEEAWVPTGTVSRCTSEKERTF